MSDKKIEIEVPEGYKLVQDGEDKMAVFKLTINTPLIHCSLSPLRLPLSIKVSKLL
jgi:hypothetical protein